MTQLIGWIVLGDEFIDKDSNLVSGLIDTQKLVNDLIILAKKGITIVEHRTDNGNHIVFLSAQKRHADSDYYGVHEIMNFVKEKLLWSDARIEMIDWETLEKSVWLHEFSEGAGS